MTNRCITTLTVSHPEPFEMMSFMNGIRNNNLFRKFLHGKYKHGIESDVGWGEFSLSCDKLVGHGKFCTSDSPPITAFEEFKKIGFKILAEYICVEHDYYGSWTDGQHNHFDYSHLEAQRECFHKGAYEEYDDDADGGSDFIIIGTDEHRAVLNERSVDEADIRQ